MFPRNNNGWYPKDHELQQAITACLRLILNDMHAQYRHAVYEAERLEKAGVAADDLFRRLGLERKEVKGEYVPPNTDRGVQRTRV